MVVAHPIEISYETTAFASDEQSNVFTYLYGQFYQKVYHHVYRLLTNPQDAEDVTQEVFLRVHKKWQTLYDRSNLLPWLYFVATNLSIDILRLRLHTSSYISTTEQIDYDDETQAHVLNISIGENVYGSEQSMTSVAEWELISLAFATMPKRDVQVLLLSAAYGLPYQEIAIKLDVSPSAAAARITRAKKRFTQEYRHILVQDDEFERRERA